MSTVAGGERDVESAKIPTEHPLPIHPPPYANFLPQPVPPTAAPPHAYAPPPNAPPPPHLAPVPATDHYNIAVGYQPHPYSAVVNGISMNTKEPPLPFCGIGIGWALFMAGFFFASIPWYVGALLLLFVDQDYREKCGLVACSIAAGLAFLSVIINALNYYVFW
ncbi:60S ribosomal protein L18a-like protein [Zingiber officinale]|uniref:60S ribosomal protein L18a-like protein n=1 Tax=Zingiber officinale TaxID=94328 RepID=UPI001C4D277F|nr:60S ribosomal protein L18a-like protein [Zingiber officinale]